MHGLLPPDRAPEDGRGAAPQMPPYLAAVGGESLTGLGARAAPQPLSPLLLASLVMALDLVAIGGAGLLADALLGAPGARHVAMTGLVAGLAVAFGGALGAYDHDVLFRRAQQRGLALQGAAAGLLVAAMAGVTLGAPGTLDPAWVAMAALLGGLSLLAGRSAVGMLLRQDGTRALQRAVVVGAGPQATRLIEAMRRDGGSGLRVLGLVDDRAPRGVDDRAPRGVAADRAPRGVAADRAPRGMAEHRPGLRPLGGMASLFAMIRAGEVEVVVIAAPWSAEARIAQLLEALSPFPVEVRLAPDLLAEQLPGRPGGPVLLRARPISGLGGVIKAIEDYGFALAALAVAAVPMLLIALAIKLDSAGPVLFRQQRTGFNDRPFDVLKFRTLYAEATDHHALRQVGPGDPRVTPVGAILRRTSLDELPQLFNVLRGEMSFVGPRPHAPGTRAGSRRFDEVVANYAARHRVKPGLTGLAQVRGWRGPTLTEEQIVRRVESDLEYIETWSPWLDLKIILRTLLTVACMRNAL